MLRSCRRRAWGGIRSLLRNRRGLFPLLSAPLTGTKDSECAGSVDIIAEKACADGGHATANPDSDGPYWFLPVAKGEHPQHEAEQRKPVAQCLAEVLTGLHPRPFRCGQNDTRDMGAPAGYVRAM